MNNRQQWVFLVFIVWMFLAGCGAAVVGGVGYSGYKSATDERSIGTMVDDSVIATAVKTKMVSDEFIKARHIDVDVLNSIVYLIGVVDSASQKRMAEDLAMSVNGVKRVENQLVVGKATAGKFLNDTILTSKIRVELLKDPDIRSMNIDVDTNNGAVSLTGMAKSQVEKDKVMTIVQDLARNRKIIDNIKVGK